MCVMQMQHSHQVNIEYATFNKMKSNEVPMCIICNREHLPYYDSGTDNPRDFNQEYV